VGHVAHMGEMRNAYEVSFKVPGGKTTQRTWIWIGA
jgi:hypothetical protein